MTSADSVPLVHHDNPRITTVDGLASGHECAHLIALAERQLARGQVSGDDGGFESTGRTGSTAWIPHNTDETTQALCDRIANLVGMPLTHAESIQIVHYSPTQEYRPHFDAYNLLTERGRRATRAGGQRMVTALLYLNDDFANGTTQFPKLDIEVEPNTGRLLVFDNCVPDTVTIHPNSLHAGMPVADGEKWAANLWFHERPLADPPQQSRSAGVVRANRAASLFTQAAQTVWPSGDLPANLTYWDPWGADPLDHSTLDTTLPTLQVIDGSAAAAVDNKRHFATAISASGLTHLAPATYFSTHAALESGDSEVWFVKPTTASAGRGMQCLTSEQLRNIELPPHHLVQEQIADPLLIDGRKFVTRCYVLAWARRLFVFDEGHVRVHETPWSPTTTDWDAQVGHTTTGFPDHGPLQPASETPIADTFAGQATSLVSQFAPVFSPIVAASSTSHYLLGALDYIVTADGGASVLEFNAMPNLLQGNHMNERVNLPLLTEALRLMCAGGSTRFAEATAETPETP
jgi:prolyl 4-hydroxylase